jgi:hypothetical protein
LIVAEKRAGARQRNRQIIVSPGGARLAKNAEDVSRPIHNGDCHVGKVERGSCFVQYVAYLDGRERRPRVTTDPAFRL